MKPLKYPGIRPALLVGVTILGIIILGVFVSKEVFMPPQLPDTIPLSTSSDLPEKTDPPNDNERRIYTVPPPYPRRLIATTIGIDALIKPVGILPNGSLDAPKTGWDIGWYEKSGLPGNSSTPVLLDGHVNDAFGTPGVFYRLHSLRENETIIIERGDKTTISYAVLRVTQQPIEKVDMKALLQIQSSERLVLITCGGTYDRTKQTFNDRVIIEATRI